MPSQMSAVNGTTNRYNSNKIINYSIMENNSSADNQFVKPDCVTMNNNLPPITVLEQGMSELCSFSLPITSPGVCMFDEYRLRLGSEDLGHQRQPLSCLRRASTVDGDCDLAGPSFLGLNRVLSENVSQWSHLESGLDESRLRDCCARDAQQLGFIVGDDLEMVKAKSHRSVIQNTPDRIISSFKDRYGQSDSSSKKTYLQLGVRVPTKEHVSEIVGKQGSKIKQIREKTGALITTPGEQEDHVFIIEAPPRTALHVAQILKSRAEDITMSRTQESRRRSSCPVNNNNNNNNINRHNTKSPAIGGFNQSGSKITLASGRIQVPKIIVGRIIGTQGSIITTIQRDTGTEIRSPPKEIGKPKHTMADFEILVYQTANLTDGHEARQRVLNAKQLIAHVAMHQLEKIRAEEAPYSNYQVQSSNGNGNEINDHDGMPRKRPNNLVSEDDSLLQSCYGTNKEQLLTEQMKPFDWLWIDVEKLDDGLAHEVVDRILEESKKKTKTRSEPSIFDTSGNNLFTLGESDSYSNGSSEINRPRHSLPESRISTIPGLGLDSFYRSSLQSSLPYAINDNFLLPDTDSDFRSSPSMSFINRREPRSRSDLSDHEYLDFQSQDFIDNRSYNNGIHYTRSRDVHEPSLMPHMYLDNGGDLSSNIINPRNTNRHFNRFVLEPNIGNVNYPKLDATSGNGYYSFPVNNSHWNYPCPLNVTNTTINNNNNNNNNNHYHYAHIDNGMNSSIKSYADSVRPLSSTMCGSFSTTHGTIGDHLKKTMSNNYKG